MTIKNPQSVLAHLILCGSSGWALKCSNTSCPWAMSAFAFLFGHGVLGVIRFGMEDPGEKIMDAFQTSLMTAEYILLPLVNVDIYKNNGMQKEFAYGHAISALVPLAMQLTSESNDRVVDLIVLGNIASVVFISVSKEHPWAAGLAAITTMNHFLLTRISENIKVPKTDLVAIGFSLFNIFAVHCVDEIQKVVGN